MHKKKDQQTMSSGKKVYLTAEELKTVRTHVKCTEDNCSKIFPSESNLLLHLVKTHKTQAMPQKEEREYHCPESGCIYNKDNFFFKTRKEIKQHFIKVHCSKDFICDGCNKGFQTLSLLKRHYEYCGAMFKCCECGVEYSSYEALHTHARRKRHSVLTKTAFKTRFIENIGRSAVNSQEGGTKEVSPRVPILPKPVVQFIILPVQEKQTDKCNSSTQTDSESRQKIKKVTVSKERLSSKRNSQETQTLDAKKLKSTVQTQTVGAYSTNKKYQIHDTSNDSVSDAASRISTKTQTNVVISKSVSCNTPFRYDALDFTLTSEMEKNSFGTQTYRDALETATTRDTFTNEAGLIGLNSNFDSNFFNCNSETQTDFMLDNELLSCDYYSNMHTQTCEDMLLGDIGFNNIETQTALQDVLRSVESQTLMSHTKKSYSHCRDISDTETQTDIEFMKMLEEINS